MTSILKLLLILGAMTNYYINEQRKNAECNNFYLFKS